MQPKVLNTLRAATRDTAYENRLWIVGGYVRDKLLKQSQHGAHDIDLVLEGDALAVARLLHDKGVTDHAPVVFETFGTAMVHIGDAQVELVTARSETYRQGSRKPIVFPGTLETDAERRDFTVNTLLENLHTGEARDPTGRGRPDLAARLLRTPSDPVLIFSEDPLRMLRACRFAAKLGFDVEENTQGALSRCAHLCNPNHGVSFERVRDELNKTLLAPGAGSGLERMRAAGLLGQFAPELVQMHGVTQNRFHRYDVWTHTLVALGNLPPDAPLPVRLAVLFHDVGKPATRTVDPQTGDVHFYTHQDVGAQMARTVLQRLRYSSDEVDHIVALVALHMRYGEYQPAVWTDASVRRLIRAVGSHRHDLFTIARADIGACNTDAFPTADLAGLETRMEQIEAEAHVTTATSPLDGKAIIALLGLPAGPAVGKIKNALTDAVVAGLLAPDDIAGAERLARALWEQPSTEDDGRFTGR